MSSAAPGSRIDMRGFTHELEALHKRRQWQLDAAQSRLGLARQAESQARSRLQDVQDLHTREAGEAARALAVRLDAGMYRRTLGYLAQLQAQGRQLGGQLAEMTLQREQAQLACLEAQRQVELLQAHRDDAAAAYATEALQRQAMEADRDWLARTPRQPEARP